MSTLQPTTNETFEAATQEVMRLLQGLPLSNLLGVIDLHDAFGEYADLVADLHERFNDWQIINGFAAKNAASGAYSHEQHEKYMVALDDLGGRDSVGQAVAARWNDLRIDPRYAGLDLVITQAHSTIRQQAGQPLTLVQILNALAQASDIANVKHILRSVALDAANFSTADLLTLTDTVQHKFGVPQTWLKDWQRTIKAATQASAGGNGSGPPASGTAGPQTTGGTAPSLSPTAQFLIRANRSDTGDGECLVHLYGDRLRYCDDLPKDRKWLVWDGQRWQTDLDGEACRLVVETVRSRYREAVHIQDLDDR